MKRTYISMATAILLGGGVQAHAQHFVTTVEQANALVASPARVVQAAPGSIWRHKTGVHYTTKDNGATWTKIGDIAFSYDTKGNLLSQKGTNAVSSGSPDKPRGLGI